MGDIRVGNTAITAAFFLRYGPKASGLWINGSMKKRPRCHPGSFHAEAKRKAELVFEQAITPMRFTLSSDGVPMRTKTWAYPASFVLLAVSIMLKAAPLQSLECPEMIPSASVEVIEVPGDWVPYVASPLYLHAAAPMYGPAELEGDLTDFKEARTANEWSYTYALDGAFPEGKWLQCAYGERNQVGVPLSGL
jgi:hypothetical protein